MYNENAAMRFMDMFKGLDRGHGVTRILGGRNDKGKVEYESEWVHSPATLAVTVQVVDALASSEGTGA